MNKEQMKGYERPTMQIIRLEPCAAILAGSVDVGGWGDGGNLGGGEAEEGAPSRRGTWGNLWYNN